MESLFDGRPRDQLERVHLGQVFGLNLHRQEFMTGKLRTKGRPGSVDFGLVAAEEISNHRGDAGDMNMQLILAAACGRIYSHSDLVSQQLTARPLLNEMAGIPAASQ